MRTSLRWKLSANSQIIFSIYLIVGLLFLSPIPHIFTRNLSLDSKSYYYFLESIQKISFYQRPPLYPFLLWVVSIIDKTNIFANMDPLVMIQVLLSAVGTAISGLASYKLSKNLLVSTTVFLLTLFNFQITAFTVMVTPETLLF